MTKDTTGFTDSSAADEILRATMREVSPLGPATPAVAPPPEVQGIETAEPHAPTARPPSNQRRIVPALPLEANRKNFTLRLDVLYEQGVRLKELEQAGVPIEGVLRSAAAKMDFFNIKEVYEPQVQKRRFHGISHRVNLRIPIGFFERVERTVEGGETIQRKALISGQFEPQWFAYVDEAIERMEK